MRRGATQPLVSICVPTYNGAAYLEDALRSAFAQTYPAIEMVISDDASSDETLAVAERVLADSPWPARILHHEPRGIGANWNHCVRNARGEYVKFLLQDDLLAPDCVERMMTLALQDPTVGLVYSRRRIIADEDDPRHQQWAASYGELHEAWLSFKESQGVRTGRDYLGDPGLADIGNAIGEPTAVLLKASAFERDGYFDEDVHQELDFLQWYRVMRHHDVGFVDAELVAFRLHPSQETWRTESSGLRMTRHDLDRYYLRHLGRFLDPMVRRRLMRRSIKASVRRHAAGAAVLAWLSAARRTVG